MNKPLVFVDGDQGTTGLQIVAQLQQRDDVALLTLPEAERKNPLRRADAINRCDVAILCLPDAAAREAAAMVENPAVRVIDASSAHRTAPGWVYGLPELSADQPRLLSHGCRRAAEAAGGRRPAAARPWREHPRGFRLFRPRPRRRGGA